MAYSFKIPIVQGDNLPGIQLTIRDRNNPVAGEYLDARDPATWAPVNLRNSTVTAEIRELGGEVIDTVVMQQMQPEDGIVLLPLGDTKFQQNEGQYELEATVVYTSSNAQQTVYDWLFFDVRERF